MPYLNLGLMLDPFLSADLLLHAAVVAEAGLIGTVVAALVTAAVLIGCAYLMPGVHISSFVSALLLAIVVAVILAVAGLLLPTETGGGLISSLIALVVTAGALILGDKLMDSVRLDSFGWAFAVAVVLAVVSYFLPTIAG